MKNNVFPCMFKPMFQEWIISFEDSLKDPQDKSGVRSFELFKFLHENMTDFDPNIANTISETAIKNTRKIRKKPKGMSDFSMNIMQFKLRKTRYLSGEPE